MIGESRCRCRACGHELDPTVVFQRCPACDGRLKLRICRYLCRSCGTDVPSRFVFDGIVFDREYFRQKMAESRERKQEQRETFARLAIDSRSEPVAGPPIDLEAIPGLVEALDSLAAVPELAAWAPLVKGFDLKRYQEHITACLRTADEKLFDSIPALDDNRRLDRIWRFIALIFMAHAGVIHISQYGQTILISKQNEADSERS